MADDLRERIAKAIAGAVYGHNTLETAWADLHEDAQDEYLAEADAVIRELDGQLIDFALWLSEELRGEPLSRIDAESCLQEWKWLNDESRWLRGDDDDPYAAKADAERQQWANDMEENDE